MMRSGLRDPASDRPRWTPSDSTTLQPPLQGRANEAPDLTFVFDENGDRRGSAIGRLRFDFAAATGGLPSGSMKENVTPPEGRLMATIRPW